jgi:hypothetical protein
VSVGTARGTASVVAAVAAPVLLAAMWFSGRGSLLAIIVWLGAAGYPLRIAVMSLFGTPYDRFLLACVDMFAFARGDVVALAARPAPAGSTRLITRIRSRMRPTPRSVAFCAVVEIAMSG